MWSPGASGEEADAGVIPSGHSGYVSLHFLLDQLPPRVQSLWDNKIVIMWGRAGAGGGGGGGREGAAVSSTGAAPTWDGSWATVSLLMPLESHLLLTRRTSEVF